MPAEIVRFRDMPCNSQQYISSDRSSRQPWRNPDLDKEQRKLVFKQTMKCIHNALKVEVTARRYEKMLYLNAASIDEYANPETIKDRVVNLLSSDSPSILLRDLFSLPSFSEEQRGPTQSPSQQTQQNYQKKQQKSRSIRILGDPLDVEPCTSPPTFSPVSNVLRMMPPPTSRTSFDQPNTTEKLVPWDSTSPVNVIPNAIVDQTSSQAANIPTHVIPTHDEMRMDFFTLIEESTAKKGYNETSDANDSDGTIQPLSLQFITSSRANKRRPDYLSRAYGAMPAPILKAMGATGDREQRSVSLTDNNQRRVAFAETSQRFESDQQPLVYRTYDELMEENQQTGDALVSHRVDSFLTVPHETNILNSHMAETIPTLKRSREDKRNNNRGILPLDERKQQRLIELHHASICTHDEQATNCPCPVSFCCSSMKALWNHMEHCSNKNCGYDHCSSSRNVLSHFQSCQKEICDVCTPVHKQISKITSQMQSGMFIHNDHTSSEVLFDPLLHSSKRTDEMNADENNDLATDSGEFSEVINTDNDTQRDSPSTRPTKKSHAAQGQVNFMVEKDDITFISSPPYCVDISTQPP